MLHMSLTVRATSVLSVPRPLERPEAAWRNISHTGGKRPIKRYNEAHGTHIIIRQVQYLNNIVEQDHRAVKRVTRPMLGFKGFETAQSTLVGIELMHMLRKQQLEDGVEQGLTVAGQVYALAA
jgi:transposase-like protein